MHFFKKRKAKKILFSTYASFLSRRKKLSDVQREKVQQDLLDLKQALQDKNEEKVNEGMEKCLFHSKTTLKKSAFIQFRDLIVGLAFALVVALAIRQLWFELYEIPTGSMRPTYREKDRLVVSKTSFGLNFPFSPGHFYFNPDLVKRSETAVFTVEGMDVRDADIRYFYLFPGKKQLVKRILGKPGDMVYFYGGKVYGIDQEGRDISAELQFPCPEDPIDHIPFIRFDGSVYASDRTAGPYPYNFYRTATLYQMNEPVARLTALTEKNIVGDFLPLKGIHDPAEPLPKEFAELWGMKNFAYARLVTKEEMVKQGIKAEEFFAETPLYLELRHHPSFSSLEISQDAWGRYRPNFKLERSFVPLHEEHLKKIFSHLYTARFCVNRGKVARYSYEGVNWQGVDYFPRLLHVPDGCFEFYFGKAYQVVFGGHLKELDKSHPLNQFSIENTKLLFNQGIEWDNRLDQFGWDAIMTTSRYSYFRDGGLYLMGSLILAKEEPLLQMFVHKEQQKQQSSLQKSYSPFIDEGAPLLANGSLDKEKIRRYGLLIPEKSYLALGDNYAMSSDSRDFGFVPQGNLRGSPFWIFWPFGERFGIPNQPQTGWITTPNLIVWSVAAIFTVIAIRSRNRNKRLAQLIEDQSSK